MMPAHCEICENPISGTPEEGMWTAWETHGPKGIVRVHIHCLREVRHGKEAVRRREQMRRVFSYPGSIIPIKQDDNENVKEDPPKRIDFVGGQYSKEPTGRYEK